MMVSEKVWRSEEESCEGLMETLGDNLVRETGQDMHGKYRKTTRGGLAVNAIEC